MNNGFRNTKQSAVNTYKQYDPTKIDLSQWTSNGPDLTNVPFTQMNYFGEYETTEICGSAVFQSISLLSMILSSFSMQRNYNIKINNCKSKLNNILTSGFIQLFLLILCLSAKAKKATA